MVLSREEGEERGKERGRRQHRAVENGGWRFGFFKKRTNERGEKKKKEKDASVPERSNRRQRERRLLWRLGFSPPRLGDRDRRRHLQKVFLVVVVFEEQSLSLSLSLSLSDWDEERGGAQKGVLFFKK